MRRVYTEDGIGEGGSFITGCGGTWGECYLVIFLFFCLFVCLFFSRGLLSFVLSCPLSLF